MRRKVLIAGFVTVLLTVLLGGHVYLAQRLVIDPDFAQPVRGLLLALICAGGGLLLLQPVGERLFPVRLARALAWPASVWMGFAFFLLALLILSDFSWLLLGMASTGAANGAAGAAALRAVVVVGLAGVASAVGLQAALRGPLLRRLEITLPRWPQALDGFRIVQLSDLHLGPILDRRFAHSLVERCAALQPDLIVITGDLVDGKVERVGAEVAPLAALQARHGVFFITGNHDHYSGADAWVAWIRGLGIQVLRNERVSIGTDAAFFELAGVEDHHAHLVSSRHREDADAALAGRDPSRAVILLAHDPATFPAALRLGVDLQLSGHTHGGQIWPFEYLVRLSTPYVAGHYSVNGSQLYVSRGTGFWGPAMRFRAPAEITEITVRAPAAIPGTDAGRSDES
jgi:predicted MPP superfamily phosphohydrolase